MTRYSFRTKRHDYNGKYSLIIYLEDKPVHWAPGYFMTQQAASDYAQQWIAERTG